MRTLAPVFLLVGWTLSSCASAGGMSAREDAETPREVEEMGDLLGRMIQAADAAFDEGYSVSRIFVDRIGDGAKPTLSTSLTTPHSYRIAAAGGERISHVQLGLEDADGAIMAADSSSGGVAIIEYIPYSDEQVALTIEARSAGSAATRGPDPFYFLLFSRRGGMEALGGRERDPKEELAELVRDLIAFSVELIREDVFIRHIEIDRISQEAERRLGYPLHPGTVYQLVGRGGPGTEDLDLALWDEDDDLVDSDLLRDNTPVLSGVRVERSGEYTIEARLAALDEGADPRAEYWFYWILGEER